MDDFQPYLDFLTERGEPAYRLKQFREAVFQRQIASFDEITTYPEPLRAALTERFVTPRPFVIDRVLSSGKKDAFKAALRLNDGGHLIESVLLRVKEPFFTVCVSSQVGCANACSFCATGTMGLTRNLTTMEIAWQVLHWIRFLRERRPEDQLTNVVFMGMGEPLMNMRSVLRSLELLVEGTGMSAKRFSVSTSGVVPMITQFAEKAPKGVNLAISLHAANDALRSEIVPLNKRFPLKALQEAARAFVQKTDGKIFYEWCVLGGVNDSRKDAAEIGKLLRPLGSRAHMNLINMNPVPTIPYQPATAEHLEQFREWIREEGVEVTIRRDHGQDIMGACGQLVTIGRVVKEKVETSVD